MAGTKDFRTTTEKKSAEKLFLTSPSWSFFYHQMEWNDIWGSIMAKKEFKKKMVFGIAYFTC